jgi:hypothetical protein
MNELVVEINGKILKAREIMESAKTKEERQLMKNLLFPMLYAGDPKKLFEIEKAEVWK